ncbi:response regulator [[Archangium] primigenium]|uniref:response regulator n=1 Tax=Melittangium TaxID=44 RepID=UPI00195B6FB4|nr:response regulator [Archangium primigenium]MBM7112146.1 response regulator [Archangium primigenium]
MARILVIDDSPTVALSMSRLLLSDGHLVETVHDVAELPGYLGSSRPDLVLLDLEMPALPGVEWAAHMRRFYQQKLSLIIHSYKPWDAMEAAAQKVGAVGIIPKGASADAARCIINSALRRTARPMG